MSFITLLAIIVAALGIGYFVGRARGSRTDSSVGAPHDSAVPQAGSAMKEPPPAAALPPVAATEALTQTKPSTMQPPSPAPSPGDGTIAERARILRSYEAEAAMLRRDLTSRDAALSQLTAFEADRRGLYVDLASSRAETARYRQLVIDLENDAPPPFFGIDAPDDLKLIVGIGPVLERMLQQLGVATYRQIARWSERDIDEFDARLHEFPGRIRRDAWVIQARALHQSKYGEPPPLRERG